MNEQTVTTLAVLAIVVAVVALFVLFILPMAGGIQLPQGVIR